MLLVVKISNKSSLISFLWDEKYFEEYDSMSTLWERQQQVFYPLLFFSYSFLFLYIQCFRFFFSLSSSSSSTHLLRTNNHALHINIRVCLRACKESNNTHMLVVIVVVVVEEGRRRKTILMQYFSIGQFIVFICFYLTLGKSLKKKKK